MHSQVVSYLNRINRWFATDRLVKKMTTQKGGRRGERNLSWLYKYMIDQEQLVMFSVLRMLKGWYPVIPVFDAGSSLFG